MITDNLVFGIPTQRSKKEEKYPETAVLTMYAEGEKGTAKKVDINTFAAEALEFKLDGNDTCNFAFIMEGDTRVVYFANTSAIDNPTNINVTKQATFSNKKMYEYLAKVFELDTTKDNEFLLSCEDGNVARVSVIAETVEETPIILESIEDNDINAGIETPDFMEAIENNVN